MINIPLRSKSGQNTLHLMGRNFFTPFAQEHLSAVNRTDLVFPQAIIRIRIFPPTPRIAASVFHRRHRLRSPWKLSVLGIFRGKSVSVSISCRLSRRIVPLTTAAIIVELSAAAVNRLKTYAEKLHMCSVVVIFNLLYVISLLCGRFGLQYCFCEILFPCVVPFWKIGNVLWFVLKIWFFSSDLSMGCSWVEIFMFSMKNLWCDNILISPLCKLHKCDLI